MNITRVRMVCREGDPKFKGVATIYLDDCFVVREVKVIQGPNGLFISMPSRKNTDGTYSDIAHPITVDCRKMIEAKVLEEYQKELERVASGESQARRAMPFDRRGDRGRSHGRGEGGDFRSGSGRSRGGPSRGYDRSAPSRPPRPSFEPSRDLTLSGKYGPEDTAPMSAPVEGEEAGPPP